MKIGAQMYSVYKHLTTLEDIDASFAKVADIGYKALQVSGTCPFEPEWMRDTLKKYGLTCEITHVNPERLLNDTENMVKEHRVFGCSYIGIGGMPNDMRGSIEGYEAFRDAYIPVAKKMKELGATFTYHNHWFEFDEVYGKNVMERILEDFPSGSVGFTLDLGWAAYGNADVVKLIEKLAGNITRIHLKDYGDAPEGITKPLPYLTPIYEGKLDYDTYIKAAEKAGAEFAFVEQDWCYDEDEFDCLKRSFDNVVSRFPSMR